MDEADKKPTLREAASLYLATLLPEERQEAQPEVQKFVRWYGADRNMVELKPHDVSGYAAGLGVGLTDAAARLEPVRAFLSFARKKKFTAENMAVHLRPPKALKATKARSAIEEAPIELTPEGITALEAEVEELRGRRPQIAGDLRRAMADKDFRENAPLDAAREQQAHIEGRIRDIESALKHAVILESGGRREKGADAVVEIGSTVQLRNLKSGIEVKYTLVSPREVDPGQGKISIASPVGKALVKKRQGDEVEVAAPSGSIKFRIEGVQA